MEEWYTLVRNMGDERENRKEFENSANTIFRKLALLKIKDKRKFQQRLGNEYETFAENLNTDLLNDDAFFELTFKLRRSK